MLKPISTMKGGDKRKTDQSRVMSINIRTRLKLVKQNEKKIMMVTRNYRNLKIPCKVQLGITPEVLNDFSNKG